MGDIYIVRHGETDYNLNGTIYGQLDVPLNEVGKNQVKEVALELQSENFDVCFCSPLQRTRDTAAAILEYHPIPIYYDDRLMELYKGALEGAACYPEKMPKIESEQIIEKYNWESKTHFYKRVENFYDEILDKFPGKNILIVGHCGTLRMSSFYFNPPDKYINDIYYNLKFPTGAVLVYPNKKPFDKPLYRIYNYDNYFEKKYNLNGRY